MQVIKQHGGPVNISDEWVIKQVKVAKEQYENSYDFFKYNINLLSNVTIWNGFINAMLYFRYNTGTQSTLPELMRSAEL